MKDIDFDELDRAVASALGGSSQSTEEKASDVSQPDNSVVTTDASPAQTSPAAGSISAHGLHARIMPSSTPPSRSTLSRTPVMTTNSSNESDAVSPASTVASVSQSEVVENNPPKRTIPHREGRFMDVVRPGSTSQPSTPKPIKATADTEVSLGETPASEATNSTLESAINELLVSESHTPVNSNIEKLDSVVESATNPPETAAPSTSEEADQSIDQIAAELGQIESEAPALSGSPFLADAKVEKRPLGGAVNDELVAQPLAEAPDLPAPEPEPENAPVPEELQNDLTAIETGSVATTVTHENDSTDLAVDLTSKVEASVETPAPVAGPTSIARQYKEQPRTASENDESGAIFDPQTYQQPIEHPAKKSSGWGWVIAIIVIVLLAVAAAVGAWFAGLLPVAL